MENNEVWVIVVESMLLKTQTPTLDDIDPLIVVVS